MKTLFTITVLIAGIYLFIQQEGFDKLSKYLPQYQIDKSAETLLTSVNKNVDTQVDKKVAQKFEQLKKSLLTEKNARINTLEKKLEDLQAQFTTQQSPHKNQQLSQNLPISLQKDNVVQEKVPSLKLDASTTQNFPSEPALAKTQYLTDKLHVTAPLEEKNTTKQKAIKRQANLQDIAARMNKTSLLALTH